MSSINTSQPVVFTKPYGVDANQHHVLTRATVATLEAELAVRLVHATARIGRRQELATGPETAYRRCLQTAAHERAQFACLRRVGAIDVGEIEPVCGQVGLFASVQRAVEVIERSGRSGQDLEPIYS